MFPSLCPTSMCRPPFVSSLWVPLRVFPSMYVSPPAVRGPSLCVFFLLYVHLHVFPLHVCLPPYVPHPWCASPYIPPLCLIHLCVSTSVYISLRMFLLCCVHFCCIPLVHRYPPSVYYNSFHQSYGIRVFQHFFFFFFSARNYKIFLFLF